MPRLHACHINNILCEVWSTNILQSVKCPVFRFEVNSKYWPTIQAENRGHLISLYNASVRLSVKCEWTVCREITTGTLRRWVDVTRLV